MRTRTGPAVHAMLRAAAAVRVSPSPGENQGGGESRLMMGMRTGYVNVFSLGRLRLWNTMPV